MKTGVSIFTNVVMSLTFSLILQSCNKEDFYEKEYLDNPFQNPTNEGTVNGGGQGGSGSGTGGGTQGGVDSGTNGGTSGGTTGSSSGGTTSGGYGDCNNGHGNDDDGVDESNPTISTEEKCKRESFRQASEQTKKLDIIWIIDNSGSMADEQSALGLNFSSFINEFINKNVDFKMAITTTDASTSEKKGSMITDSDVKLTSAMAKVDDTKFKADFNSLVKVGTTGSGNEKGLEASEGFMQKYASSFLRPDAYLVVVVLTDEEDQSANSVSFYTDYLKSFKPEAGLVKIYTIADVNKTNSGYGITPGAERYISAAHLTSGVVSNIRDSFHQSLTAMGDSIINLLDSFALASLPVSGSLKVYVNDIETTDFSYDLTTNSIKFDANRLPPVGAEIEVYYIKQ